MNIQGENLNLQGEIVDLIGQIEQVETQQLEKIKNEDQQMPMSIFKRAFSEGGQNNYKIAKNRSKSKPKKQQKMHTQQTKPDDPENTSKLE